MAEHTPTPWETCLNGAGNPTIREVGKMGFIASWIPNEANAAFIVKAVNMHQELVDALKAAAVVTGHPDDAMSKAIAEIIERASA